MYKTSLLDKKYQEKLITAEEAKALRSAGKRPAPGAVLTPLAKEILEGTI